MLYPTGSTDCNPGDNLGKQARGHDGRHPFGRPVRAGLFLAGPWATLPNHFMVSSQDCPIGLALLSAMKKV
jgi:hypothetical protein